MEKYAFTAYISKDVAAGRFKVSFPNFPDCSTEGKSFPEAYVAAWTALGLHSRTLEEALKEKLGIKD
jgi:predicted RNase H-like HicB family nuclease